MWCKRRRAIYIYAQARRGLLEEFCDAFVCIAPRLENGCACIVVSGVPLRYRRPAALLCFVAWGVAD